MSKLGLKKLEDGTTISTVPSLHLTHLQTQFLIFVQVINTNGKKSEKNVGWKATDFKTHPKPHSLGKILFNFWIYFSRTLDMLNVYLLIYQL